MITQAILQTRKDELRRRVEALPKEVAAWRERTLSDLDANAHFSQLQAITILTNVFEVDQVKLLGEMDSTGDLRLFENKALDLVKSIIASQRMWDFFRDKLDLRFSPSFKEVLWVADTVAWDCYRPVMDDASGAGIIAKAQLREPPLTYLTAEFSPATWIRGSRPNDGRNYFLGTARLPIPVIEMPWDHVENTWEFMSLHHEVAHDIEADLKLRPLLAAVLQSELVKAQVPADRIATWQAWHAEIFADLVGLQLGGPAFAEGLMHLLLLPKDMVIAFNPSDPHPTHYARILMNAAYIPTMIPGYQPLADHGAMIATRWKDIYGDLSQFNDKLADFPVVAKALMDSALPELNGLTVRQLVPYKQADDQRIRSALGYLQKGTNKPGTDLRPRHVISAARLAVTQAALDGKLTPDMMTQINAHAMGLVRDNAALGLRAGDNSKPHEEFIAGFASEWQNLA